MIIDWLRVRPWQNPVFYANSSPSQYPSITGFVAGIDSFFGLLMIYDKFIDIWINIMMKYTIIY